MPSIYCGNEFADFTLLYKIEKTMEEEVLFESKKDRIVITSKMLKIGEESIAIRNIAQIDARSGDSSEESARAGESIIFTIVLILIGFGLISSASEWSLLGLIMLGWGGYNVYSMFRTDIILRIDLTTGQSRRIHVYSKDGVDKLKNALEKAMSNT